MAHDCKIGLLLSVYEVYDHATKPFTRACGQGCSTCCTQNVLCTTLEADLIMDFLERKGEARLVHNVLERASDARHRPSMTLNDLAGYCLRREEPPEQESPQEFAACPFLENQRCLVYPVRPFSCRGLWSEEICQDQGQASMNPVLISLNGVFEQIIEHMDSGGLYGNLFDQLAMLTSKETRESYRSGKPLHGTNYLPATLPNPGFLVPPLHRPQVISALNVLWGKQVDGIRFRDALKRVRSES